MDVRKVFQSWSKGFIPDSKDVLEQLHDCSCSHSVDHIDMVIIITLRGWWWENKMVLIIETGNRQITLVI